MNKLKLLILLAVASLTVGCATNSDIENLQSQVDGLKVSVNQISTDLQTTTSITTEALTHALNAEKASIKALEVANEVNAKLDNVFKKAMVK